VAATLSAQQRKSRLDDGQRSEHVGVEVRLGLGRHDFFDSAHVAVTCIAKDHVETTKMVVRLFDRLEDRIAIGNVERQGKDGVAIGSDKVVEGLRVASGRGDSVAALERGFRPDAAEPAGSSGDEPYFVPGHSVVFLVNIALDFAATSAEAILSAPSFIASWLMIMHQVQ
jgi:hypothetical protein